MSLIEKIELEYNSILQNLNGAASHAHNQIRQDAFLNFKKAGIPTIKNEDWKYSSLKGLEKFDYTTDSKATVSQEQLKQLPFANLKAHNLVFVNGKFKPELSDALINDKVKVLSFSDAEKLIPEILDQYYGKSLDIENESLSALNVAISRQGFVTYIPENTTLDLPIVIKHINAVENDDIKNSVHHLAVVGKNAEAKFVEIFQNIGEKSAFTNIVSEFFIEKDARVDYYKIQDENANSFHVGTTQVLQKDHSYFYAATFTINGGFVRNNLNMVLDGEYIENHMYGLYVPNGNEHIDNHSLVDHKKPNSESNELYKGILDGHAKGVFNGKIFVREDAQKTNAYQNCRNVIISDTASMNTKPQLEIWADDVKCSHGTTTGKLDDDAIFYMQSRGIPKAEAVKLQLAAFAEDVLTKIKWEDIVEELDELLLKKLKS